MPWYVLDSYGASIIPGAHLLFLKQSYSIPFPHQKRNNMDNHSVQFSSVAQLCLTLCDPMNRSTPGLPVHHQLLEFTQTHVHRVSDAIQPSHPLSSPFPPALNPSQHQSLFQWVNSSHDVAKVLEFQLSHHSFQRNPRADLLDPNFKSTKAISKFNIRLQNERNSELNPG